MQNAGSGASDSVRGEAHTHERTVNRLVVHVEDGLRGAKGAILELQAAADPHNGRDMALCDANGLPPMAARVYESVVDMNLLRQWYTTSLSNDEESSTVDLSPPIDLLVIDVVDECVLPLPRRSRYAALSYTWGKVDVFRHLRQHTDTLGEAGSLRAFDLPLTIRDAMFVTQQVGERYLWVDSICIVQDDDAFREGQLKQMGRVYAHASLTLVAAAGTDANAGLPGVRPHTRQVDQAFLHLDGLTLVTVVDPRFVTGTANDHDEAVAGDQWIGRAWTMQEQLFSKRCMFFTERQVYWFSAPEEVYLEETVLEGTKLSGFPRVYIKSWAPRATLSSASASDADCWDSYRDLVEAYSRRSLSYASDKLNAFAGFADHLSGHKSMGSFIWGLPQRPFSAALAWTIEAEKRHMASHTLVSKAGRSIQVPIPSWSWAAWNGSGIRSEWARYHTASERRQLRPYPRFPEIVPYRVGLEQELIAIEQSGGHYVRQSEAGDLSAQWKGPSAMGTEVYAHPSDTFIDSGRLRFWTSVANISVRRIERPHKYNPWPVVSHAALTGAFNDSYPVSYHSHDIDLVMGSTAHLRGQGTPVTPSSYTSGLENDTRYSDEYLRLDLIVIGRSVTDDDKLDTLVVEWKDAIAYRLGYAQVSERLWVTLPRVWKLVTLG